MNQLEMHQDDKILEMLELLRAVPTRSEASQAAGRANYLAKVEQLTSAKAVVKGQKAGRLTGFFAGFWQLAGNLLSKGAVIWVAIVLAIAAISVSAVSAAQGSLPGKPLYPLKIWVEAVRLSLRLYHPQRVALLGDYSSRRIDEINRLSAAGQEIPETVLLQLDSTYQQALKYSLNMEDEALRQALIQLRFRYLAQLRAVNQIKSPLLRQRLVERLQLQLRLINLGIQNPRLYREKVQSHLRQKSKNQTQGTPANTDLGNRAQSTPRPPIRSSGSGSETVQARPTRFVPQGPLQSTSAVPFKPEIKPSQPFVPNMRATAQPLAPFEKHFDFPGGWEPRQPPIRRILPRWERNRDEETAPEAPDYGSQEGRKR